MLKYIELPHVSTYKRRWVRRIMIVVTFPQALVLDASRGEVYLWAQSSGGSNPNSFPQSSHSGFGGKGAIEPSKAL